MEGIDLAVEKINGEGGVNGHTLELEFLDDQSDQTLASSLGERLVAQDVTVLLGASFGSTISALGVLAQREEIPIITPTVWVVEEQQQWDHVYWTLANFDNVARAMLGYAEDNGLSRIGLLRLSREYGVIGSEKLHEHAADFGVEIVAEEEGADADSDFTSQLTNIGNANPDGVFVWFANPAGANVLLNMQQLGMDLPTVSPLSMAGDALIEVAGGAADGAVVQAQLAGSDPLPRQEEFVQLYEGEFGETPQTFEAVGWDMVHLLAEALKSVEDVNDRQSVKEALDGVSFEGAAAIYNYSQPPFEPDAESIVVTTVRDGEFVRAE